MTWLRSHRIVAGILYLMFAFFAAAVLTLWLLFRQFGSFEEMFPGVEAKRMLFTTLFLFVASAGLGISFFVRPRIALPRVLAGGVVVTVAFTWNIVTGLLWLMPALFAWAALRQALATNNAIDSDTGRSPLRVSHGARHRER